MPSTSVTLFALLLFLVVLAGVTGGVMLALRAQERRRKIPDNRDLSRRGQLAEGSSVAPVAASSGQSSGQSSAPSSNAPPHRASDAVAAATAASMVAAAGPVAPGIGATSPGQTAFEPTSTSQATIGQREEAVRRGERAERLRNLLLAKMNHDVRTPLNSIITLSGLLVEGNAGPLSVEQRRYLEVIHRNGESLLSMISTILDLSALEAGRVELDVGPVDVVRLLGDVTDDAKRRAKTKGLAFHLSVPRDPREQVPIHVDRDRLRQVVSTLLETAVARTSHGYVELALDVRGNQVHVRISDTGAGPIMQAGDRDLEEFLESLDPLSERPGDSAPALPVLLAGRIVPLMGGQMTIEGTPGEGTTYSLVFPLLAGKDVTAVPAPAETAPAADERPLEGHVLIIEDDELERQRLRELTLGMGCQVTIARSGQEGLSLLSSGRFDAVVLDLVMPGMTGLDVLRTARADERLHDMPFVVVSALFMTKSEREVLGPGVVAVVRKGDTSAEELRSGLRAALGRRRTTAGATATTSRNEARSPSSSAGPTGATISKSGPGIPIAANIHGRARVPEQQNRSSVSPSPGPGPSAPHQAHVLIVDDNADNLFSIRQVLAALPVSIESAASGPEAIAACRRRRPDLIVMDVELPGQSGLQTTRAIHSLPDCQHIPVIAITAEAMRGDRERALAAECSDYLAKPIQPKQVVSAVTRALHIQVH